MNKLIARARLAGKIIRFAPFLRLAALNGSIVQGDETSKSDIDILIVAKHGRLYTCRFFATLLIHLTGWRRHGRKIAGRICLNCYLSDQALNIYPEHKKSIPKVVRAYKYMIPLVDDKMADRFQKENQWFASYNLGEPKHSKLLTEFCFARFPLRPRAGLIEFVLSNKFGDLVEARLMRYQQKRILSKRRTGDEIFASEKAIKLHPKKY